MWEKLLLSILQEHRGKAIGVFLGLVAGILVISYGFWKALFIMICIFLGYFIGKKLDEDKSFDNWLRRMFKDN